MLVRKTKQISDTINKSLLNYTLHQFQMIYNMNIALAGFSSFAGTIIMPIPWKTKLISFNILCCIIICLLSMSLSLKHLDDYLSVFKIHILQFILDLFEFGYVFITFVHYYHYVEARFL
jgi:hypothetical protein